MLLANLTQHAALQPKKIALHGATAKISYEAIFLHLKTIKSALKQYKCLAILLDNHPAWVLLDLAALDLNTPIVPLPLFFTHAQCLHAMQDAGVDCLITDQATPTSEYLSAYKTNQHALNVAGLDLTVFNLNFAAKTLPANTTKITYTSGTTGNPKGVCLSANAQLQVANAIKTATQLNAQTSHLCVLPLSTLLENVAGVYATLLAGGTAHVLPCAQVGLSGNQLDVQQLLSALNRSEANTAIILPALLSALVAACEAGATLANLRFLAVGGAHVAPQLLTRAAAINLPVFEGYGLSECASVVALNTLAENKLGSVGKPLPHVQIEFSQDQEILVKGTQFLAYTNDAAPEKSGDWLATGDIGFLDEVGFLHIKGRKKNMFITSFGRNINPEWLETTLINTPEIAQACVFGEAKPFNVAVIFSHADAVQITAAINTANQTLPDYAQIKQWLKAETPFNTYNNQLTSNGRLKRDIIWQVYQTKINALYQD